jgi:hypothetical protein
MSFAIIEADGGSLYRQAQQAGVDSARTAPGSKFEVSMSEYVIQNREDLIEALRSRKEQLGLSNAFVEAQLHMADGGCDKVLGPSQVKGMSSTVLLDMIELLGAQLVIRIDAETEARMQKRWERRNEARVRPHRRLSKELLELARAQIFKELSARGNEARRAKVSSKARSRIARSAALCRWKHRAVKVASASEGVSA